MSSQVRRVLAELRQEHGRFAMDDGADGAWREYTGAIVMPHRPHRFDGRGSDTAMVFVEPETSVGRALKARFGAQPITPLEPALAEAMVAALRADFEAAASDARLIADGQRAVSSLADAMPQGGAVDRRVERVIAWMRGRLQSPIALGEAAAQAHLSASRFRHLFVAQTGVSFRAYLLWTSAAQSAGFADSAHLSRTCRRMFGIAPAMLVKATV